jgi:hypothetical protein
VTGFLGNSETRMYLLGSISGVNLNFGESDVLRRRTDLRNVDRHRVRRHGLREVDSQSTLGVVRESTEGDSRTVGESDVSSKNLIGSVGTILRVRKCRDQYTATSS